METVETVETVEGGEGSESQSQSQSQSTPLLAQKASSVESEGAAGKKGTKNSEKTTTTTTMKGKGKASSIMSFFAKKWSVCLEETRRGEVDGSVEGENTGWEWRLRVVCDGQAMSVIYYSLLNLLTLFIAKL